jgi:hypothetical protein
MYQCNINPRQTADVPLNEQKTGMWSIIVGASVVGFTVCNIFAITFSVIIGIISHLV